MNNGELILNTLQVPRVPVGALYLGNVSNYQESIITGAISLIGDLTDVTIEGPTSVGPISFSLIGFDYTAVVVPATTKGLYQDSILIKRLGNIIGKIVISITIFDLSSNDPPPFVAGITQLLQVNQEDFQRL
jgi:hypothetical protein